MSALPNHDLTDHLHRQAIREIQDECHYSIGLMAYELGSDPTTLKRWLAGFECENPIQQKHEDRLVASVARYLTAYTGPEIISRRTMVPTKRDRFRVVREYDPLPSGRQNPLPATCPKGHTYDQANTGFYRASGRRYCKTCKREGRRA